MAGRLSALVLLLLIFSVSATDKISRFDRFYTDDGLSHNSVYDMVQDRQGFLWLATGDGLNRFDGYQFKVYHHDPNNPFSLSSDNIKALHLDGNGRLWVATYGGLNLYHAPSDSFVRFVHDPTDPTSISSNLVLAIESAGPLNLWIGTEEGLNLLNIETGVFIRYFNLVDDVHSLSQNFITSLHSDHQGTLWVGTKNQGLNRFDEKRQAFWRYQHLENQIDSIDSNMIKAVYHDSDDALWVATDKGLNRLRNSSLSWRINPAFERFSHLDDPRQSSSEHSVVDIYEDSQGVLWIATLGAGLKRIVDRNKLQIKFDSFVHQAGDDFSLSRDYVVEIYEDNLSQLWIGTESGGLNKISRMAQNFGYHGYQINNPHSINSHRIWSFFQQQDGTLWIGTEKGINRQTALGFTTIEALNDPVTGLTHNFIHSFVETEEHLWVGTHDGLNRVRLSDYQVTRYFHQKEDSTSLSNSDINSMVKDKYGVIWIGTAGGLNRYNPILDNFDRYVYDPNDPYSLSHDVIIGMLEDERGLWIGTLGGGLNYFDRRSGQFTHYKRQADDPNSLADNAVWSLYKDDKGILWIGTGEGLNRFDPNLKQVTRYNDKNRNANNTVYGVLGGENGTLWLSVSKGLALFDPKDQSFRYYDVNDGLQSNDYNRISYYQSPNGELFFGGQRGFNRFYAKDIQPDPKVPNVVLTDFLINNKSVPVISPDGNMPNDGQFRLTKTIDFLELLELSHKQNLVTFEFSAIHFANPMKNRYAYKLEGQDDQWIQTDASNRRATYSNLSAGDYVLKIKASNGDGIWDDEGKQLNIRVHPAPWRTWWAYMIYFSIGMMPVLIYLREQKRKIAYEYAQNVKLEAQVARRTEQLQRRNQQIEQQNREIIDAQQQIVQSEKMASLGVLTAGVAHEINNPNNFVYVSMQSLEYDLKQVEQFFVHLAGADADEDMLVVFKQQFEPLYEHLETMREGSERIKIIVKDLRTFTQLDAAEQQYVDVTTLIEATVNLVKAKYLKVIDFKLDFRDKPEIYCYPAQLNQVFMNLIVNGCHAIEAQMQTPNFKGVVTVRCIVVNELVLIDIIDNGCGMTAETQDKLFEPFFTTKDVGEGTGLGLSISYGIIKKHKGELRVGSVYGKGSTFTIELPLRSH